MAEGRQEDEDCRYYTIPLTKITRPFLLWVVVSFPGRFWGLFSVVFDVLGAFSATLRASLGFAQSKYFRRSLVPRLFRFLVKALPGDDVRFARVRLRHNNREPFYSPSLRWFLSFSLNFLAHGNIFWIGKG